jgi:hypothetical protein
MTVVLIFIAIPLWIIAIILWALCDTSKEA